MEGLKAQDLRRTNIIYFPFHDENVEVIGLPVKDGDSKEYVQIKTQGTVLMEELKYFKPITLTEEWLIKFGFKKYRGNFYGDYILNGYKLDEQFKFFVQGSSVVLRELKYVHQLQNLYYSLTGKELVMDN